MTTTKPAVAALELRPEAVAVARKVYLPGASALPLSLPVKLTLLAPAVPVIFGSVPRVTVFFLPFTVFLPSTSSFTEAGAERVKEIVVPFGALPVTVNFDGFSERRERLGLVAGGGAGIGFGV